MRTLLLFAGFFLAFTLSACDSTGIDGDNGGGDCYYGHCNGGGGGGDNGGNGNGGNGGGNGGNGNGGSDAKDITLDINPRQTYLRTSNDQAVDAPAVSLANLGYDPGEEVCFRVIGDFSLVETYYASERGTGYLTAVFSSSNVLRPDTERYRVSGAIDAGNDVFTLDTDRNALATDIDQDFRADDVCLTVPNGAEYVFFAAFDSLYGDNGSIDGTPFQVRIEK